MFQTAFQSISSLGSVQVTYSKVYWQIFPCTNWRDDIREPGASRAVVYRSSDESYYSMPLAMELTRQVRGLISAVATKEAIGHPAAKRTQPKNGVNES